MAPRPSLSRSDDAEGPRHYVPYREVPCVFIAPQAHAPSDMTQRQSRGMTTWSVTPCSTCATCGTVDHEDLQLCGNTFLLGGV